MTRPKHPQLPNEITLRILHAIGSDDKHTLAQCMAVSPTFNALVAPILYRSVVIDEIADGLSDPFRSRKIWHLLDIPPVKAWMKRKGKKTMKTQGKRKDLAYIRHVTIKSMTAATVSSWKNAGSLKRTAVAPSVRSIHLSYDVLHRSTPSYVLAKALAIVFPNASKLIFHVDLVEVLTSMQAHMKSVQYWISIINDNLSSRVFRSLSNLRSLPSTKVAYVLTPDSLPTLHDTAPRHWSMPTSLAGLEINGGSCDEILMVVPDRIRKSDERVLAELRLSTEGRTQELAKRLLSFGKMTSEQQARKSKIRYLTLTEYLDTHDWSDEFTEEQIKSWRDEAEERVRSDPSAMAEGA